MNTYHKNATHQQGFSALEALIIIVIIGVIGVSMFAVSLRRQAKTANQPTKASQNTSTQGTAALSAADYTTYSNAVLGFSFAYPKDWGTVTVGDSKTPPATGTTPALKDSKKYPYYQGALTFTITPKGSYHITGQLHGATYVPVLKNSSYSNYVWKVVSVDPADITDKIGDIYNAPVVMSDAGVQLYDFNVSNGNLNTKRWAFETKAGFVTLALPQFGSANTTVPPTVMSMQQSITDTMRKSIQLIY